MDVAVILLIFCYTIIILFFVSFIANVVLSFWTIYRVSQASVIQGSIFIAHIEVSGSRCKYSFFGPH